MTILRARLHQASASIAARKSVMTLAIPFLLKTMESIENGLQRHSGATPLFSTQRIFLHVFMMYSHFL